MADRESVPPPPPPPAVSVNGSGAVGRATPSLTGAKSALAVSQSSSIAMLIKAWKARLQRCNGCTAAAGDFFLFCDGGVSMDRTTNRRAMERTKRRTTALLLSVVAVVALRLMVDGWS